MFRIEEYLDSTYLKTPAQAHLSEEQNLELVKNCIQEAIESNFKLVMIRPEFVALAKQMIIEQKSSLLVGTVIGFHEGVASLNVKLEEAKKAINDQADELDFVINFKEFKNGNIDLVKQEVLECSKLVLENNKIIKWIIETAALTFEEIIQISSLIRQIILENFESKYFDKVFVKSSTGFFVTSDGSPNGATFEAIRLMLEYSDPLPVKASGGVKSYNEALKMIQLGVKRIGTSSAKLLSQHKDINANY